MTDVPVTSGATAPAAASGRFLDILTLLVSVLFYLLTLYPGVGGVGSPGDAAKFQYVGHVLGVPHSPGYPLYVMLTWLWTRAFGWLGLATAVNAFSAVLVACALVLFRRALTCLRVSGFGSFAVALALGLSPGVQRVATQAGPNALGLLLAGALLWAACAWAVGPSGRALAVLLILMLVAAGHDTLFLWLVPAWVVVITLIDARAWLRARTWLAVLAGFLLGYGVYAYVYIRSHQGAALLEYVPANATLRDVARTALGAQFWPNWFFVGPGAIALHRLPQAVAGSARGLHYVGGALAALGVALAWRWSGRGAWFVYALTVAGLAGSVHMFAPRIGEHYWLFTCGVAAFAACGLGVLQRWHRSLGVAAGVILLACAGVHAAAYSGDRPRGHSPYDVEPLLLALPTRAVIITDDRYAWQEVIRYFEHTNPFVAQRELRLSNELRLRSALRNYFFTESVREQMDEMGVPYVPLYTNDARVLYAIGVRTPAPGD